MSIFDAVESKLGLPSLEKVSEMLKSIPDERKLKEVKSIMNIMIRLKGEPQELETVTQLVRLIAEVPEHKLEVVKEILIEISKLMKMLPKDGMRNLPVSELLQALKK